MSVIIRGLDMPNRCADCPMCYNFDVDRDKYFCSALDDAPIMDGKEILAKGRKDYCPLEEVEG